MSLLLLAVMLVSSLYDIVDQIFIGRGVGYLGNGATNIVFPITVIVVLFLLCLELLYFLFQKFFQLCLVGQMQHVGGDEQLIVHP